MTDADLDQVNGDADTLISIIQEKYQEPRISIEMQLKRLMEGKPEARRSA